MGLFSEITQFDNWALESLDYPDERILGQFPIEPTKNVSSAYAQHKSLNRASPIIQFLNGNADTISFEGLLYAKNAVDGLRIEPNLAQLIKWAKRDDRLNRPHLLRFWVGDGHLEMQPCIMQDLNGIRYMKPTITGAVRQVTFNVNLTSYEEYSLDSSPLPDTRYHRAKYRDYYEFLSYKEYGTPEFGDVIRKLHPTLPNVQVANVIKLPSRETVSSEVVEPTSLQLQDSYGKTITKQKQLRLEVFDRTNRTHTSHIIKD